MSTTKLKTNLAFCFALVTAGNLAAQDCDQNGIQDANEMAESSHVDSNQNGILDVCEGLSVDLDKLSLLEGGVQRLKIDMSPSMSGRLYRVLGTLYEPGIGMAFGPVEFPLMWDGPFGYMRNTLFKPNSGFLKGGLGMLDSNGQATPTFTLPPNSDPILAGLNVYHAYLILTGGFKYVIWSSNWVRLELVP